MYIVHVHVHVVCVYLYTSMMSSVDLSLFADTGVKCSIVYTAREPALH